MFVIILDCYVMYLILMKKCCVIFYNDVCERDYFIFFIINDI